MCACEPMCWCVKTRESQGARGQEVRAKTGWRWRSFEEGVRGTAAAPVIGCRQGAFPKGGEAEQQSRGPEPESVRMEPIN